MMRSFSNTGALGAGPVRLNTTDMSPYFIIDLVYFRISAARLSDGRIAVVWVSLEAGGNDRYEVRARILDQDGKPLGKDFLVHASATGSQNNPEIVVLPGARFTVVWSHADILFVSAVKYRTFSSAGKPVTDAQVAHSVFAMPPYGIESALLSDGSIVDVMQGTGTDLAKLTAGGIASPAK